MSSIEQFKWAADDSLAEAHADVSAWVEAVAARGTSPLGAVGFGLKSLPSGQKLLDADKKRARDFVLAAIQQVSHWDARVKAVREQLRRESPTRSVQLHHEWEPVSQRHCAADEVVKSLLRRSLPFESDHLRALIQFCLRYDHVTSYHFPVGALVRSIQRFVDKSPIGPELLADLKRLAERIRASYDKDVNKYGTVVEQICYSDATTDDVPAAPALPAPRPAPAGDDRILTRLKQALGMLNADESASETLLEPDRFPMRDDTPLRAEHELLSTLFAEVVGTAEYYQPDLPNLESGKRLLALSPAAMGQAKLAAAERHVNALLSESASYEEHQVWQSRSTAASMYGLLPSSKIELTRDGLFDLLLYCACCPHWDAMSVGRGAFDLFERIEQHANESPLTEGERYVLSLARTSILKGPPFGMVSEEVTRLTRLIGDGATYVLAPGEYWADNVNDSIGQLAGDNRKAWINLFKHALTAKSARPSAKWLKTATALIESLGHDDIATSLEAWLPLVNRGRSVQLLSRYVGDARGTADTMIDENATILRGLLWCIPLLPNHDALVRLMTGVALTAYKKVPGVGPRAVKVGNAAVYALSEIGTIDAVGQLAILKVRIKFGSAQKEIEKAYTKAAADLGLPRDQIEEMGVPSYGFEEVGRLTQTVGDYRAEIIVSGSNAELKWYDAKGKALKSVPAKARKDHADDVKELKQTLKDAQAMLPAQRDRIDSLFLAQANWPIGTWRERYLNHPLVGTIARRLIWCVDGTPAEFLDGEPRDVEGKPIEHGQTSEITLWHPIGQEVEAVTAWRNRLETLGVTQPFKQAHREVCLLTDAERNTRTYSNRFAAHVLRQHQFNALCAARSWKNKLRLMVDDEYPPAMRELPQWGLRAEYWVEGAGDEYGEDTNETGVYYRILTDQVRFYRTGAAPNTAHAGGGGYETRAAGPGAHSVNEPLPLDEIPPLVFSEIMRDVDLFVGVASVGNDPTWQDGGPEGRFRDYWAGYSFGELSATAATRRKVLERMVPKLKIADRCSVDERFLIVRGDKRTYKIHMGSGNILMEPDSQYLCIVPASRSKPTRTQLYLPFEGDNLLSVIISKALMLADDTKIKDPTIVSQIDNRK